MLKQILYSVGTICFRLLPYYFFIFAILVSSSVGFVCVRLYVFVLNVPDRRHNLQMSSDTEHIDRGHRVGAKNVCIFA